MMSNQSSVQFLTALTCILIDLPLNETHKNTDCSTKNPNICVSCRTRSRFINGEFLTKTGGWGHTISLAIWTITVLIGSFGVVTNIMVIIVLKTRANKESQYDFLVTVLAIFDIFSCICACLFCTSFLVNYCKFEKNKFIT